MKSNWKTHVALCGLALVPVVAWSALAPAPFSTGPTPIGSLPFTINDPGTYCLTGNLTGGPGPAGILVQAADVVIDLGGFVLAGGVDSDGAGIFATQDHVTVRNGTVEGWGRWGIELFDDSTVSDVHVRATDFGAIKLGARGRVERSRAVTTSGIGILASTGIIDRCEVLVSATEGSVSDALGTVREGVITSCTVTGGRVGISTGSDSVVRDCTAIDFLSIGFAPGSNSVVEGCSTRSFEAESGTLGSTGFFLGNGVQIENCIASGLVDVGIRTAEDCRIEGCQVVGSRQSGIVLARNGRAVGCSIRYANTGASPDAAGIRATGKARVESCTVSETEGAGIRFEADQGRVERCDVEDCSGDGIVVQSDVHLAANRVVGNMGAGIRVLGDRCVLLENVVDRNNDRGIVVDGRTSHLERNRAAFNKGGDYDLEWGNPFGKIERPSGQMSSFESQTNYETPFGF